MRFREEWRHTVERLGRWIDFDNDYKSGYLGVAHPVAGNWRLTEGRVDPPRFTESEWWVFKQLFEKGQVYQGHRVMPYSTALDHRPGATLRRTRTTKIVTDPAVVVAFPLLCRPRNLPPCLDDDSMDPPFSHWSFGPSRF